MPLAQLRLGECQRRVVGKDGIRRIDSVQPKLLCRSNPKLIAGYPSDSPVSTTDEEWEAEDLGNIRDFHGRQIESMDTSGADEVNARIGFLQHQAMLSGSSSRSSKRHWAPGEGVIDQHLFLLDDRPWQEFYTLVFTPIYIISSFILVILLVLLLIDGTVMRDRTLIFLAPVSFLAVGLSINMLFVCLFPIPNGSTAPAYDSWSDPFNQQ